MKIVLNLFIFIVILTLAFAKRKRKYSASKWGKPRGYRQSFIDEINNKTIGKRFRTDSNVNMVNQPQVEVGPQGRYLIHINPQWMQPTKPPDHSPQYNYQCPMTSYKPWEVPKTQEFTTDCCMKLQVSTSDESSTIKKGEFDMHIYVCIIYQHKSTCNILEILGTYTFNRYYFDEKLKITPVFVKDTNDYILYFFVYQWVIAGDMSGLNVIAWLSM